MGGTLAWAPSTIQETYGKVWRRLWLSQLGEAGL